MQRIALYIIILLFNTSAFAGPFSSLMSAAIYLSDVFSTPPEVVTPEEVLRQSKSKVFRVLTGRHGSEPQNAVVSEIVDIWTRKHLSSRSGELVTLLLGNSYETPSQLEIDRTVSLLRLLLKSNLVFLYDADSKSAQVIEQVLPQEYRLGVTANKELEDTRLLIVPNPKTRIKLFSMARTVIISPNSPTGIGYFLDSTLRETKKNIIIFDAAFDSNTRALPISDLANTLRTTPPEIYTSPYAASNRAIHFAKKSLFSSLHWKRSLPELDYRKFVRHLDQDSANYLIDVGKTYEGLFRELPYRIQSSMALIGQDEPNISSATSSLSPTQARTSEFEQYPIFNNLLSLIKEKRYVLFNSASDILAQRISSQLSQQDLISIGIHAKGYKLPTDNPFSHSLEVPQDSLRWYALSKSPFTLIHSVNRSIALELGTYLVQEGSQVDSPRTLTFVGPSLSWLEQSKFRQLPLPQELLNRITSARTIEDVRAAIDLSERENRKTLTYSPNLEVSEQDRLKNQERQKAEEQRRKQEEQKRREEEERKAREYQAKALSLRNRIFERLSVSSPASRIYSHELKSRLSSNWFKNVQKSLNEIIFLGIGSPDHSLNDLEVQELTTLCQGLNQKSHLVIYDADTPAAGHIEAWIDAERRLGFTSDVAKEGARVLFIGNPYLRMKALLSANTFVISPNSITGIGLLIEGQGTPQKSFMIFDPLEQWPRTGLVEWSRYLDFGSFEKAIVETPTKPEILQKDTQPDSQNIPIENKEDAKKVTSDPAKPEATVEKSTDVSKDKPRVRFRSRIKNWWNSHFNENNSHEAISEDKVGASAPLTQTVESNSGIKNNDAEVTIDLRTENPPTTTETSQPEEKQTSIKTIRVSLENLGVRYSYGSDPDSYSRAEQLLSDLEFKRPYGGYTNTFYSGSYGDSKQRKVFPAFSGEDMIRSLSYEALERLNSASEFYLNSTNKITHDAKFPYSNLPTGAVVFGSAKGSELYAPLLSDVVTFFAQKGLPIATGGSGGYMQLANSIATKENVASIGIPISGGRSLFNERFVGSDQTHTVSVSDYEDRIPLLLHDKKYIVIAPGGSGTMKELATALIQQGSIVSNDSDALIIFVSKPYYKGLFEWLTSLPLDESLIQRIKLISDQSELQELKVSN